MPFRRLSASSVLLLSSSLMLLSGARIPALEATDPTGFHLQWAWSVAGDNIGLRGLEVVDLDADGRSEILVAADPSGNDGYWYLLERQQNELVQISTSLPRPDGVRGVGVGFENGISRIVVAGRSSLTVYDGATRRELASFPTPFKEYEDLAVADIDADGVLDAVLSDGFDLWVYELGNGSSSVKYGFGAYDIDIGQIDADPQLEIALAGNPSGGFVLDGATLAVDWADLRGFGFRVRFGNFDADSRDEVASLITQSAGLRVQDPETGALIWEIETGDAAVLAAADIDGDEDSELFWGGWQSGAVHVLDGSTSTELRVIENPDYGVMAIALGDTDQDGTKDVVWGSGQSYSYPSHLNVARGDSTVIAARTRAWAAPFRGIAVGDFAGNGSREVAAASADLDGSDDNRIALVLSLGEGRLLRSGADFWGGWVSHGGSGFASGQLDGDAALELCLAGGIAVGCYDGATFEEQWRVELPDEPFALRIGELDGDAVPELVAGTTNAFAYAFEGESGWLKWRTPAPAQTDPPLDLVHLFDVTGDARKEVIASSAREFSVPLTTFAGENGLVAAGPWNVSLLSMTALPGGGSPESLFVGDIDGAVAPLDPLTGVVGAPIASFPDGIYAFGFADFDRDGTLDIAALLQDHFEVQDGETGQTLYVSPYLGYLYARGDSMLVGDLDGNSVPEILVATSAGLALFEAPLFTVFADGFESGDTSHW